MTSHAPTIVALLPMKAHSQRVKNKNFRSFAGKPLYRHILDTLLSFDTISRVVINTDARHILATEDFPDDPRIQIRDRKAELCGDHVSMNAVLADDVAAVPADIYIMTHTTNPLLKPETIEKALKLYEAAVASGRGDSLFTVNKIQTRFYTADGKAVNHDPDNLIPTQDLTPWFEENSNLYIFSADSFHKTGARIGAKPVMYEMDKHEAADIDVPADWAMAEALLLSRGKEEGLS